MIKYLCIIALYYGFPLLFTQGSDVASYITLLFAVFPLGTFLISLFPSMKYGFEILFSIACGVIFIPAALWFFNESAIVYALAYSACALFGSLLGGFLKGKFQTRQ